MSSSPQQSDSTQATAPNAADAGDFAQRHAALIALVLIGLATTGYFIGLTSPMTANSGKQSPASVAVHQAEPAHTSSKVIPATAYAQMPAVMERGIRQQGILKRDEPTCPEIMPRASYVVECFERTFGR